MRDFHTKFYENWVRITEVSTCIYCTHSIGAILMRRISRCPTFCIMAQKIGLTLTNGCKNLIPQLLEWSPVKKNTLKFTGTLSKKIKFWFFTILRMRGSAMLIQWEEEEKSDYENSKKIKVFLREKKA